MNPEIVEVFCAIAEHYQEIEKLKKQEYTQLSPVEIRILENGIVNLQERIEVLQCFIEELQQEENLLVVNL